MNDNKKRNNIIYAVIGILVFVISVTGATFAYYTATETVSTGIGGNMATITFNVLVDKKTSVDTVNNRGLIPMTNSMMEKAVTNASGNGICLDDNSNAACQVYKITINNTGTAGMFLDGYVSLTGGSGSPTDYSSSPTTMRWAQLFCTEETDGSLKACTTAGKTTTRATNTATGISTNWAALGTAAGHATTDIKVAADFSTITTSSTIKGNTYPVISTNYIRVNLNTTGSYKQQTDVSNALVYNQYLEPNDDTASNNTGDSSSTYTDSQIYYIVVWLSETGTDQTAGVTGAATSTSNFFTGTVTFVSAQGSEVTGTFYDYTSVTPDTAS